MHSSRLAALLALLLCASAAFSQANRDHSFYSRLNTFGVFGEYSNDSSHIVLGLSQNRKLLDLGGTYSRRVLLNRHVDGQYMAELRPVMFESDPVFYETIAFSSPPPARTFSNDQTEAYVCRPSSATFSSVYQGVTYSETDTIICRRRWTFGEGFSPLGFKLNFFPRRRIQPVLTILGGYMFAARPIPVADASSANFTFSLGAGFEWYRSATRSIRAEYRFHHLSNAGIADDPGIDSQLVQITYAFGR
jgi:opacity protein-like surface antigen